MSLDKLLDYLEPKTFGKIHYVVVVFWILIGVIPLVIFAEMENSEPRFDFRCGAAKSKNIDFVRGKCYEKYQEQYNKFALPVYGFVIINFVLIIFVFIPRERTINGIQAFYRLLRSTIHKTCFRSCFHHPTNSVALSFKVFL